MTLGYKVVFPTRGQRPQTPVHLPQPPQPHTMQMATGPPTLPPGLAKPAALAPTAPQGLGLYPLGGGVWWGSLELGLGLCTPPQLPWFLRVWGPFGPFGSRRSGWGSPL